MYNSEKQKNVFRAGDAGPTGSNQTQGKGEIPGKVSVPMPGTNATQTPYKKMGTCPPVPGFSGGVIPGKV
jgi:hypothetical protein